MKKYNLFKVLGITFLVAVILTWVLPSANYSGSFTVGARYPIGLFDLIEYPVYILGYYAIVAVFLLSVGGLYGVLENTVAYKKLIERIKKAFGGKEKWFLIIAIVSLAILSAICGLNLALFILFPFFIAVILELGYDKLTAIVATAGATLIGMFGSIFSSSMYNIFNSTFSITYTDEIFGKIALLVVGLALLITFTLLHGKKVLVAHEKKEKAKKAKAKKEHKGLKLNERFKNLVKKYKEKDVHIWPLATVLIILLVLLIMGSIDWAGAFNVNVFTNFHSRVMAVTVNEWPILYKILGNIPAFGSWTYDTFTFLIVIATLIIVLCYRIKFNDMLRWVGEGVRKMLVPAALVIFAHSFILITVYNPIFLNITNFFMGITDKFNVATSGIAIMINSIFNMDIGYFGQGQLSYIMGVVTDTTLYPLISMMFVSLFSAISLIAPTSIIMLATLSYMNVSYTKWVKFIWKLFLGLIVAAFIIFTIILLI